MEQLLYQLDIPINIATLILVLILWNNQGDIKKRVCNIESECKKRMSFCIEHFKGKDEK